MIGGGTPSADRSWQNAGLCIYRDPELWDGVRTTPSRFAPFDFSQAKAVCDVCPVAKICLEDALAHGDIASMRGGKTPGELEELLRLREEAGSEAAA